MKVHILDDWFNTLRGLPCFDLLAGHDVTVWTDHQPDEAILADRLQDADCVVLFRERTKVTRGLLERLPNLRLISQRGAYPHVDVAACTDQGVLLCSNKGADGANHAAAELTFALILAAMRQLPQQMASVKAGNWQMGVGRSLRGRRLGLYGYGRIGRVVADYARAFGMEVVWWSSEAGRARAEADGETVAESRAAFFGSCDVVSLHLRLTSETRGSVTADDLGAMPPRSVLVNTSRAGLIAEGALLHALDAGDLGAAAVDVFDTEPLTDPNDPLLSHPKLIATPHIGFVTEDEFDKQFADIFEQVNAYAAGDPNHMINPSVYAP
ncbi:MAG: D-2-hydroxyacid dehydrogenase family protein [Sulfitobacter sp.]|uniref:D-2-hydroxyacid dehydrogenase family protein n=1 Tax=Sulfitobacter TaxID=60136 RepID=UPI000066BEB5|nr:MULTISPECIES: D-2-hydroxyacid dehydrogenase family protein [unclassified Sulfitobacter]AXI50253.1 3-phosphoglycerate dehydrogenase [Sulfitobacter sp. SK025]EAP80024.1 D-isomer specific 2-hydroxyacid dehydrogenase [Sulfitobacter sp. NAS-14.1]MCP3883411.1 D-2-hydroxyacid dehydrogenase family protein [Sulfitobacter sp.]